ncbi:MAG: phenylalanine--tRNA ligase subunit beta [Campylobacterota bacterium]|nr:phenylalanine--tRNA ligase subunit beta [Campylobacterota bacterium]
MIVTRHWLQEFIDISKVSTEDICARFNSIGLEVDSVSKVVIPQGVVVGKVLECIKHPDADKLNICQVDIGSQTSQIVCGAKNVAQGQYVPVATVGSDLGDNFIIKKAKLRGAESHGMICSSTEIGLAKLNNGILELDDSIGDLEIGKPLNQYPLLNDEIIEIELTANRGDCLSINGVARELSTAFKIPMMPYEEQIIVMRTAIGQILDINASSNCNANLHFKAAEISNLTLSVLHKIRAASVDIAKENEIEIAVAYATHSTGVLLNVYTKAIANQQKDKVVLNIKKCSNNFDCVYGDTLLSIIGVEAGSIEKCDNDVILEASYINPEYLAQKVFDTKQKTGEVYYKSSRGSEPDIDFGLSYLSTLLSQHGATMYQGCESISTEVQKSTVDINLNRVNAIIGQDIDKKRIDNILTLLGFDVKDRGENILNITIPLYRHDIKNIADITEEIVRIIGIDNIQAKPVKIDESNRINKTTYDLIKKNQLRSNAINNGFFETVTYVFGSRDVLEKYNFDTVLEEKDILNPIVNELNTFRTSILPNLVEAASNNVKSGYKSIALFEIGTVFDAQREESRHISFIFSGEEKSAAASNNGKPKNIEFFDFANKVANVVGKFELEPMHTLPNDFIHPFQHANVIIDNQSVGYIAKLHPTVCNDYDLSDTFIAQINFDALKDKFVKASSISKYQSSTKDLSFIAPKDMPYKQIKTVLNNLNIEQIKQYNLVDIYSDEKLGDNESLTIRFVLQSDSKTLEDEEITSIMQNILTQMNEKLNIGLR